MRKIIYIISLCFSIFIFGTEIKATTKYEDMTVRVGVFNMPGYIEMDEDGNCSGYGFEYLKDIQEYTGWTYEFVEGTWDECKNMLMNGEIDILGSCQYTEERAKYFAYPSLSGGVMTHKLYVSADNNAIQYEDFSDFQGITVGVLKGSVYEMELTAYGEEYNFTVQIENYNGFPEMSKALEAGQIDAMIGTNLIRTPNVKCVGKFGLSDVYFATGKNNTRVLDGINYGMGKIYIDNANYNYDLYERVFQGESIAETFTTTEVQYIEDHPTLQVAVEYDRPPFSYIDKKTGEYKGICADFMKLISRNSGIEFKYVYKGEAGSSINLALSGKANLLAESFYLSDPTIQKGFVYTLDYTEALMLLIGRTDLDASNIKDIAIIKGLSGSLSYFQKQYPDSNIVFYKNSKECIEAVSEGRVDATFLDSYLWNSISKQKYKNIGILSAQGSQMPICIGISKNTPDYYTLESILNKAILEITPEEKKISVINNTLNIVPEDSIIQFVGNNRDKLVAVFFIVGFLVIGLISHNRKKREKELEFIAYTDEVTGIPNWSRFKLDAEKILESNDDKKYALILCDINKFKVVNDVHGVMSGNRALTYIAEVLVKSVNKDELAARVYADVFSLLLAYEIEGDIADRIEEITKKLKKYPSENKLSPAFGIYQIGDRTVPLDIMSDRAMIAKKTIKGNVLNTYAFFDETIRVQIIEENEIVNTMEMALANREFVVYLQPKYSAADFSIVGAEALVRWKHKEKGLIPPGKFIPLFEKNQFIEKLDHYVWEEICKLLRKWLDQGHEPVPIAVNVSRNHLHNKKFIQIITDLIQKYNLESKYLELEITEDSFFENTELLIDIMKSIQSSGFSFAMDDFGSGYSSLKMLKDIPINVLKIDREFFKESNNTKKGERVVQDVISMAKNIKIQVVCEGVETKEQVEFLKRTHCDIFQGYYFAKPMEISEFEKLMRF